jgi:hypothetical protein
MVQRIEVQLPDKTCLRLSVVELRMLKAAILEAEGVLAKIQETEFRRKNLDLFETSRDPAVNN